MGERKIRNKGVIITILGLVIMTLMILSKVVPASKIAGYSVFVGIIFFFIVEIVTKIPENESGLRFKTFANDIKKPWVLPLTLLPILTAIATLLIGDMVFNGEFSAHVIGRTDSLLSFDMLPILVFQVIIAAFGEEIAWRGFFVGKAMTIMPFWACAILSSALFAAGHIAQGDFAIVLYDVVTIFVDGIIYALIYRQSGNCLISTLAHILCNGVGIAITLIFIV